MNFAIGSDIEGNNQSIIYGKNWEVYEAIVGEDYLNTTGTG